MKLKIFQHIVAVGSGYSGWLHWSGNRLGLRPNSNENTLRRIRPDNEAINWDKVYRRDFEPNFIKVEVLENETVERLIKKIDNLLSKTRKAKYASAGQLYFPASGVDPLPNKVSMNEIGVTEQDILFYSRKVHLDASFTLLPASNASEIFQTMLFPSKDIEKKNIVSGVLLYTDEDIELAKYVREHFVSIDKLSGDWSQIFILEKPPSDWRNSRQYWQSILHSEIYEMWSLVRWITTKPFDKSESYQVAKQLGVNSDQIPCLVLLEKNNLSNKLVLPIQKISAEYFRTLFALLERIIFEETLNPSAEQAFVSLSSNFGKIIKTLDRVAEKEQSADGIKYIFQGNTVFINRPHGHVTISDFQK